jgi:hypothetical protein
MRVDDVVTAVVAALDADTELGTLLGGERVYRMGANTEPQVPSVEYFVVSSGLRENTEPIVIQFDVWSNGFTAAAAIADRLHEVLHAEGTTELGGLRMYARRADGPRDHGDPEPRVVHRSIDFRFEPARG